MPADMWLANLPTLLIFTSGIVLLLITTRTRRRPRTRQTAPRQPGSPRQPPGQRPTPGPDITSA